MEFAIDTKNKEIAAKNAKYGIYFCKECGELSFLRIPKDKIPHFYHSQYNGKCSLSVKGNQDNIFQYAEIEKYFNILQNEYSSRWNEAIDNLIKYDCLSRLYGKEWAINPINIYINTHIENIDEALLYEFIHILSGIKTIKAFQLLLLYKDFKILEEEKRKYIEELVYKRCRFSDEIFKYVLNTTEIDLFTKFKIFCNMSSKQIKIMLKNENYIMFNDVYYTLMKDDVERYNYFFRKYQNIKKEILYSKMIIYEIERVRMFYYLKNNENKIYNNIYNYICENKSPTSSNKR